MVQSPVDEELAAVLRVVSSSETSNVATPEPGTETEIEKLATIADRLRLSSRPGEGSRTTAVINPAEPGSSVSVSGTSSPLLCPSSGQTLEYESRSGLASSKLSIVCHYNPIMDEYITSANTWTSYFDAFT